MSGCHSSFAVSTQKEKNMECFTFHYILVKHLAYTKSAAKVVYPSNGTGSRCSVNCLSIHFKIQLSPLFVCCVFQLFWFHKCIFLSFTVTVILFNLYILSCFGTLPFNCITMSLAGPKYYLWSVPPSFNTVHSSTV